MAVKRTYVKKSSVWNVKDDTNRVPISPAEIQRRTAGIEEKREYLESLKSGKVLGDGTSAMNVENMDIGALEKQLEREEKAITALSMRECTTAEKKQALKDFEEAKEYIAKNALTLAEVGRYPKPNDPEKDAEYGKAVEKSMTLEVGNPMFGKMCNQLKRAAAIIDPTDPELRNVNRYRMER